MATKTFQQNLIGRILIEDAVEVERFGGNRTFKYYGLHGRR